MSSGPHPNLAEVLETLASLAPQNYQTQQEPQSHYEYDSSMAPESPEYEPAPAHIPPPVLENYLPATVSKPALAYARPHGIDATTIIDWSAGLRSVMKTVASNERITREVQRMIKLQHENERQWFANRLEFIEKQKARIEGQKQIDAILKGVGGTAATKSEVATPLELASELKTFDMKIYRAQMQMNQEFSTKLCNFGIPFFGTKSHLVRRKGASVNGELGKGMIEEVELVNLQGKMLDLLAEMSEGAD